MSRQGPLLLILRAAQASSAIASSTPRLNRSATSVRPAPQGVGPPNKRTRPKEPASGRLVFMRAASFVCLVVSATGNLSARRSWLAGQP
jgi:hypothetical protein